MLVVETGQNLHSFFHNYSAIPQSHPCTWTENFATSAKTDPVVLPATILSLQFY